MKRPDAVVLAEIRAFHPLIPLTWFVILGFTLFLLSGCASSAPSVPVNNNGMTGSAGEVLAETVLMPRKSKWCLTILGTENCLYRDTEVKAEQIQALVEYLEARGAIKITPVSD